MTEHGMLLRNGDAITWDSRLGCPRAGKMPALQKLDVIKSSFLSGLGALAQGWPLAPQLPW